jgi:hypothetical protein
VRQVGFEAVTDKREPKVVIAALNSTLNLSSAGASTATDGQDVEDIFD